MRQATRIGKTKGKTCQKNMVLKLIQQKPKMAEDGSAREEKAVDGQGGVEAWRKIFELEELLVKF